jgi:hypothetical protein
LKAITNPAQLPVVDAVVVPVIEVCGPLVIASSQTGADVTLEFVVSEPIAPALKVAPNPACPQTTMRLGPDAVVVNALVVYVALVATPLALEVSSAVSEPL